MPTFRPSPNVTIGATQASGSSHQFTGSLQIRADSDPLEISGLATGSLAGAGSYLGLDANNIVVLTTAGGGGGGSTDVSDVDDDNVYQLVGVAGAGTGVTLTTDDDAPITFNPNTTTLQGDAWQYRGNKFAASGSFGGGRNDPWDSLLRG